MFHITHSVASQKRKARLQKTLDAFIASPDFEHGILRYAYQTCAQSYENQQSRVLLCTHGTWNVAFHFLDAWDKCVLSLPHLQPEHYPEGPYIHVLYEHDPDCATALYPQLFQQQRERLAKDLQKTFYSACTWKDGEDSHEHQH